MGSVAGERLGASEVRGSIARCCHVAVLLAALAGCASPPAVERIDPVPAGGAVVPVALERGMPVVELETHGRTLRLIVDLGGTDALALTESAVAELPVEWTGGSKHVSDAFGRIRRSREFVLDEATLGGLKLYGVHGYEVHDGRLSIPGSPGEAGLQLDGYVGFDLLSRFNVLVDYPNDRLVLVGPADPPPVDVTGWTTTPIEVGREGAISEVTIGGRGMSVVWDTGANYSAIRPDRVPDHWPHREYGRQDAVLADEFVAGGQDFGPLSMVLLDFSQPRVDAIIGTNFFEDRAVWYDFVVNRVAIEPAAPSP